MSDKIGKHVAAVILAAGRSSRMGTPKQLLEIEGTTLLRRTVQRVLSSNLYEGGISVVLGADSRWCSRQIRDLPCHRIRNSHWKEGLSTSVKAGLNFWRCRNEFADGSAGARKVGALLFVPCDLPLLSAQHINALLQAHFEHNVPLVVSKFDGVLGVPALFDQSLWDELLDLEGDEGARKIIQRHQAMAIAVPFDGGKFDLDTPQDVASFQRMTEVNPNQPERLKRTRK